MKSQVAVAMDVAEAVVCKDGRKFRLELFDSEKHKSQVMKIFTDNLTEEWKGCSAHKWARAQQYIAESCSGDLSHVADVYLRFWVCVNEEDDAVCGMVGLEQTGKEEGELRRMHLKREYRGLGLGSLLVDAVLRFGRRVVGMRRVELSTPEHNTRSIWFYKQCGFVDTGRREPTHGLEDEPMAFLAFDLQRSNDVVLFADSIALHRLSRWFDPFRKLVYVGAFNGDKDEFFDLFCSQPHLEQKPSRLIARNSSRSQAAALLNSPDALVFLAGGSCEDGYENKAKKGKRISSFFYRIFALERLGVEELNECGGVAGLSAGAMVLAANFVGTDDGELHRGFGRIKSKILICVHEEATNWADARAQAARFATPVLCIPTG